MLFPSLGSTINQSFSSVEKLIAKKNAKGDAVQGSGWVVCSLIFILSFWFFLSTFFFVILNLWYILAVACCWHRVEEACGWNHIKPGKLSLVLFKQISIPIKLQNSNYWNMNLCCRTHWLQKVQVWFLCLA